MVIGMIMVGLLILFLCGAIYCLLRSNGVMEDSEQIDNEEIQTNKRCDSAVIALLALIVALSIALGGMIFSYTHKIDMPETEAIVETTECTTAPADTVEPTVETTETVEPTTDIIPEATEVIPVETESIHIDYAAAATEPAETKPAKKEEPAVMTEREMLACVIYQEAGGNGSCDECRRRVADIVLNRVNDSRFPDTMYEVLTAYRQYGRFYWTGIVWPARASYSGEQAAVARAYRIADEVLAGQHSDVYGNGYVWQAEFSQGDEGFWCCGHFYGR